MDSSQFWFIGLAPGSALEEFQARTEEMYFQEEQEPDYGDKYPEG